jgi:hypothetical protein
LFNVTATYYITELVLAFLVHAMKAYKESIGITPVIFNLGTILRSGYFHAPAVLSPGKNPGPHWRPLNVLEKNKISRPRRNLNPAPFSP